MSIVRSASALGVIVMSENVIDFPAICQGCKEVIEDGDIYYHDQDKGFICERCPGFEKGLDLSEGKDE